MKKILVAVFILSAFHADAQLPETMVYLFNVEKTPKGYNFLPPKMISKKIGYNNQPYFSPDGKYLFYVSSIDSSNTEIFRIDLGNKKLKSKRITKTNEPEYSPKYTPDMSLISCVKVEKDKTTQHFYTYNLKGKRPLNILPDMKSIGYYEWISQNEFLSFELPEPFYLVKHVISNNSKDTLATHVGRTFYFLRNKSKIIYLDKTDSLHWQIRSVAADNLKKLKPKKAVENPIITETLEGEEDYCFLMDGSILMGHNGIIYIKKNPLKNLKAKWEELLDCRKYGFDKFYRIVTNFDNTKIALVAFKGKKP
jgi:WD40 repeat protein